MFRSSAIPHAHLGLLRRLIAKLISRWGSVIILLHHIRDNCTYLTIERDLAVIDLIIQLDQLYELDQFITFI